MRRGQVDRYVTAGYQETSTGRRIAPVAYWSDAAFQRALRIPEYLAAQRGENDLVGVSDAKR